MHRAGQQSQGSSDLSWHLLLQEAFWDLACPGTLDPHLHHTSASHGPCKC